MGLINEQIKDEFADFAGQFGPAVIRPAVVTAVNADDTIAIAFSDGSTLDDVRMKAVINAGNKFLVIPKVGSNVLVGKIDNSDEYTLLVVHEISEIKSVIDTVTHSVDNTGLLVQKGTDTLLIALVTFIEAIEPIVILEGRNPDFIKLATAKTKIQNLLR